MTELVNLSDEELMVLYQQGRMDAFNLLYERHSARVYGYLRKKIRNSAEVSDVFQAVFMKVHRSRGLYNSEFPFLPWLFTVARTVLLDAARKDGKQGHVIAMGDEFEAEATTLTEPIDVAVHGLETLPLQQRQAIDLRYREDQSFEEIAQTLNTSPANVRQLISRGIRQLRKLAGVRGDS